MLMQVYFYFKIDKLLIGIKSNINVKLTVRRFGVQVKKRMIRNVNVIRGILISKN
jgi:hypothetical protein